MVVRQENVWLDEIDNVPVIHLYDYGKLVKKHHFFEIVFLLVGLMLGPK